MIKKIYIFIMTIFITILFCGCAKASVNLKIMFVFSENPFFHSDPIGVNYAIEKNSKITDDDYKTLLIESRLFRVNERNIDEYFETYKSYFSIYTDKELKTKVDLNYRFKKDTTIYIYMPVYFEPLLHDEAFNDNSFVNIIIDVKSFYQDLYDIYSPNWFFDESITNPFLVYNKDIGPLLYELSDDEYSNSLLLENTLKKYVYQVLLEMDKYNKFVKGTDADVLFNNLYYADKMGNEYTYPIELNNDLRLYIFKRN